MAKKLQPGLSKKDLGKRVLFRITKDIAVQAARKLFVDRPNPLQMVKEFNYERAYMRQTFGNNYVYLNKSSKLYIDNWNHAIDGSRYNIIYHLDNPNSGKYFIY